MISYFDLHRQERDPKATNTDIICLYRSFFKEYVQLLRNDSSEAAGFNCCSGWFAGLAVRTRAGMFFYHKRPNFYPLMLRGKKSYYHIFVEELWSTLLYSVASVHWGLQGFVYVQFCQGPAPAFKSGWGLDFGLLGHLDSLLFQPFSWRFAALLGIIVLLCDPVWSKLYLWHRWPHVSIEYFDIQFLVHSVTGRCPNHHPSTTVLTAGLRCLGIPIQKLFDLIGFQFFFSFHTNWWIKRP